MRDLVKGRGRVRVRVRREVAVEGLVRDPDGLSVV